MGVHLNKVLSFLNSYCKRDIYHFQGLHDDDRRRECRLGAVPDNPKISYKSNMIK